MSDVIIILILAVIIGGVVYYLRKQAKKGLKCVGCPFAQSCTSNKACNKGSHNRVNNDHNHSLAK